MRASLPDQNMSNCMTVDVIEVDGNEEEDHEEEARHEVYFYDSPSKDKGIYMRNKDTGRNCS